MKVHNRNFLSKFTWKNIMLRILKHHAKNQENTE